MLDSPALTMPTVEKSVCERLLFCVTTETLSVMSHSVSNVAAAAARKLWLQERRKGLGGSDVAVLFGVHPWESPYSLWLDKTGKAPLEEGESDVRLEVGKELEPLIRRLYMRTTGRIVHAPGNQTIPDQECPCMRGTPDGQIEAYKGAPGPGPGIFEGKTAMVFVKGAWDMGKTPLYYEIQVQCYMAIMGYTWASTACLVLGSKDPLIIRDVARNDHFIAALRQKAGQWWEKHVLGGEAPPVDGTEATTRALKALYPEDTGQVVALSKQGVEAWEELGECKDSIKALEKRKSKNQNILRDELETASYGILPDGTGISYKTVARSAYAVAPGRNRMMRAASANIMQRAVEDAPEYAEKRDSKLIQDLKASIN